MILVSVGKNTETELFRVVFKGDAFSEEVVIDNIPRDDFKTMLKWGVDFL